MLKLRTLALLTLVVISISNPVARAAEKPKSSPNSAMDSANATIHNVLHRAREEFAHARYDIALKMLQAYLEKGPIAKTRPILRYYVIDAVGRIYLTMKQDPDGAIQYFTKISKSPRLNTAEQDIVSAWIGGAKEWKSLGLLPKSIHDADRLYTLGKKYYDQALKKQKYAMDPAGGPDLNIAAAYLVPFIRNYDKDTRIGEALFMMGDVRRRTWYDNEFWSENFYLIEVIRRFPHSALAERADAALDEDVHFGYSGSAGDDTPSSWLDMLKDFKELASTSTPSVPTPLPLK